MEEENNSAVYAKEVTRLWRAWRTIHEMVQDRVREPQPEPSPPPTVPLCMLKAPAD
jgi:hypothetical protein